MSDSEPRAVDADGNLICRCGHELLQHDGDPDFTGFSLCNALGCECEAYSPP